MSVCVVIVDAAACGGSIKYIRSFVLLRMTAHHVI
jgi:hypothetical protein